MSQIFSEDPYERFMEDERRKKNLISNDRSSKFSRKFKNLKDGLIVKKTQFLYGGMTGFGIGCMAGGELGTISAIQARRFILIPLSMIGSGVFFAGVMAFGSLIRSADHQFMSNSQLQHNQEFSIALHVQSNNLKLKE